jgi:hypothetical protein
MSNPTDKEIEKIIFMDNGTRILEQPELLIEEQSSFPCPCCGKELDSHTDQQLSTCLGYDD